MADDYTLDPLAQKIVERAVGMSRIDLMEAWRKAEAERDAAYAVIADILAETNVMFTADSPPAVARLDWEDGTTIYLTQEMVAVILAAMEAGS